MNNVNQTCAGCIFSKPCGDQHECRKHSPLLVIDLEFGQFPYVNKDYWCGDYVDRETMDVFDGS